MGRNSHSCEQCSRQLYDRQFDWLGFHVVSGLRDDASLWYSHEGVRTGRRGRPRVKGEKIDFENLDM